MIKFGEWLPDQPDLNLNGVTVAKNVIPSSNGYRSLNDFLSFSNATDAKIKGLFAAKANDGTVNLFCGNETKLLKFNAATSNLDDVTKSGGSYSVSAENERWRFVQFGTSVIACGGVGEPLQEFTLGSDTLFADLGGSPPKADFIAVVRDQVWTANIDEGSGRVPFRTRWSGINDATSWTTGTDQSDFQDIPDSGAITGLVGGEYAVILSERSISRATYVGSPLIYQVDRVETSRGCAYPGSVASIGRMVFYLSDDGFYLFDGRGSSPIGAEKVNKFFYNDVNLGQIDKISSAVDPENQVVVWSYTSNGSSNGTPDKLLIYNYNLNKWSFAEVDADIIAPFYTAGYNLDQLDNLASNLYSISGTLDSNVYKGGALLFGGSRDNKIFAFTGNPLEATIETGEFSLQKGKHGIITRSIPVFEGGQVTIQIGTRNRQDNETTFSTASSLTDDGFAPHRDQGRFHRIRMNISNKTEAPNQNFEFAQGVDIEGQVLGRR